MDDLQKRIEALNRKPLRNTPLNTELEMPESPEMSALRRKLAKQATARNKTELHSAANHRMVEARQAAVPQVMQNSATSEIKYRRDLPMADHCSSPAQSEPCEAISLQEVVDGIVTEYADGLQYYHIEKPASELEYDADLIYSRFTSLTGYPDGEAVSRLKNACKTDNIAPEDVLFLDLETTGLSVTPVFLVGTMECQDQKFIFKQYFARDYSEEVSIVSAISERMRQVKLLITFNGKSFDVPFLRTRAAATGVRFVEPKAHLDLLHESRRLYKGKLPNCRLQTLERIICNRCREDDIPGSEIPQAYHDFVRTGDARKVGIILLHNLYDILTMADLMHHMWASC